MRISISRQLKSSRIISGLLALLTALMLGGCSMVRLGYGQLPEISYWWVDSYLDLNTVQSTTLRHDLQALHRWHRTQELPAMAQILATLQAQASQDTTPERLCQVVDELRHRLQAVMNQAEPGAVALASSLTPEQRQHLQHQLEKRQQKWREDWLDGTPSDRVERRAARLIDRIETFYGKLSAAQRIQLRASVQASGFDPTLVQAEMQRRHQDLLNTLKSIANGERSNPRIQDDIHQLMGRWLQSPNAAYQAHSEQLTRESCQTLATLHNSSSAAQRQQLVGTLKDYEADARALLQAPF